MRKRVIAAAIACLALFGGVLSCTADSPPSPPVGTGQVDPAAQILEEGVRQAQAGDIDGAKATFERLLTMDANNKYAWFNLGYIAQLRGAKDEAIRNYDKSLAADPRYTSAMYNKAIIVEESNVDEAIAIYRQILTINPAASTTHVRLGVLLDKKGMTAEARAQFNEALAIDPSLAEAIPTAYRTGN